MIQNYILKIIEKKNKRYTTNLLYLGTSLILDLIKFKCCTFIYWDFLVSDDNSSVQSSPWQRDHSWKQTTPKRDISQEMVLFFFRPKHRRGHRGSRTRRRRPLSTFEDKEEESDAVYEQKERKKKPSLLSIVQSLLDKNCPSG